MKIMCVCASGLGSSFIVEMNVKQALSNLGRSDVEVFHGAIYEASSDSADVFVTSFDMKDEIEKLGTCIALKNLMSTEEAQEQLKAYFDAQ